MPMKLLKLFLGSPPTYACILKKAGIPLVRNNVELLVDSGIPPSKMNVVHPRLKQWYSYRASGVLMLQPAS